MTSVWLGTMAYLALDDRSYIDQRSIIGSIVGWLLATTASWLLLRRAEHPKLWEIAVVTAPASLVTLVFVSVGAAFVAPPPA
jgi:cation transporter-like permease